MKHLLPALAAAHSLGVALAVIGDARLELALALGVGAAVHGVVWRGARARAGLALVVALSAGVAAVELADARGGPRLEAPWSGLAEGVVERVQVGPASWSVDLARARAVGDLVDLPRRIRLRGERSAAGERAFERLPPGSRVRASLRLQPPGGLRNPGGRDPERSWRRAGIGGVGRLSAPALFVSLPQQDSLLARSGLYALRIRLGAALHAQGRGGALLRALALGDRGGLGDADREAFAVLGLAHLLAVSGLHLGLVAAGAFALLRRALARCSGLAARVDVRGPSLAGAAVVALGFALLAGWGVPVRRALVLLLGLGAGFAFRRPLAPLAPLSLAALWILASDPLALLSPGAQLSFVATAALALGLRHRPGGHGGGFWREGVRASATALAVTAPLAAHHWGAQAPLALAANAVAVPWTALVLLPAALAATASVSVGEGAVLGWVSFGAERVAALTLDATRWAAGWAPGLAAGPPPDLRWLLAAAGLGLLAIRLPSTLARAFVAVTVGCVLTCAPSPTIQPTPPRVVAFDVAQGDAILVQGTAGALLVDAGGAFPSGDLGRRAVVPALRALGVTRLDWLVASHGDLDHRGGLAAVLEAVTVAELWLPAGGARDPSFDALRARAAAGGVPVREVSAASAPVRAGDLAVEVLWPPAASGPLGRNDRSLVLRVELAGRRVLLPGDLERAGEQALVGRGVDLSAQVLKLAHHGSRSSSSAAFLEAVSPEIAIASAPCRGRWGMPHREVRERLRAAGAALWWTGRDGGVRVGLAPRLHVVGTGPARACDPPASAR